MPQPWTSLHNQGKFLYMNNFWRGDLTEGFLRYEFGGLIHGVAYLGNFSVVTPPTM